MCSGLTSPPVAQSEFVLSWHQIQYSVPPPPSYARAPDADQGPTTTVVASEEDAEEDLEEKRKIILNGVSGFASSGRLTAILGPSGSGKTSLINVLAGRVPPTKDARLEGDVRFNDQTVDTDMYSGRIGYVEQEDALFAFSSAVETLMFAAQLR